MIDYAYIGSQIRKRRRSLNITQVQLAKAVGQSDSFIGHLERGSRKPSLETLVAVADVLDLALEPLLRPEKSFASPSPDLAAVQCAEQLLQSACHMAQQLAAEIKQNHSEKEE